MYTSVNETYSVGGLFDPSSYYIINVIIMLTVSRNYVKKSLQIKVMLNKRISLITNKMNKSRVIMPIRV